MQALPLGAFPFPPAVGGATDQGNIPWSWICRPGPWRPTSTCAADPAKAQAAKRKADELQPPTDPFSRSSFLIVEPTSGKQIGLTLLSKDGSAITLDYGKSKEILVLKPAEIISWKSVNAGSGTDASGAVSVAVAGALFFWPMMLAAPFMVKNTTISGFQVETNDRLGNDVSLDFASIESARPAMELLRFSTGLPAGARRGPDATQPLYEAGLKSSLLELETLKQPLLVVNNIKPWCSTIQLTNNPDSATYRGMAEHINALRRKLELPPVPDLASQPTAQQWEAYPVSKPGLRQWAAAYRRPRRLLPNARDCHHACRSGKPRYRPRSISLAIRSELRCWKPAS